MMDTPSFHALMPLEYIPPSIPTLCNLLSTMFQFGDDNLCPTKGTGHDLSSLASPKGEMKSSFSWTSFLKSPTSSTSCFGDPLNQVISVSMCETVFCTTKYATKPLNTKTWAYEFTQESSNHSPGPMEVFKTQADESQSPFMTLVGYHPCLYQSHKLLCKEHKCPFIHIYILPWIKAIYW